MSPNLPRRVLILLFSYVSEVAEDKLFAAHVEQHKFNVDDLLICSTENGDAIKLYQSIRPDEPHIKREFRLSKWSTNFDETVESEKTLTIFGLEWNNGDTLESRPRDSLWTRFSLDTTKTARNSTKCIRSPRILSSICHQSSNCNESNMANQRPTVEYIRRRQLDQCI